MPVIRRRFFVGFINFVPRKVYPVIDRVFNGGRLLVPVTGFVTMATMVAVNFKAE
jgi:hypothetical protein